MANFAVPINLNKKELQNAVIQNLASDPSSPLAGQVYFNTVSGKQRTFNGTTWDEAGTSNGTGDFSTNTATSVDGEIVVFSGTGGKTGKRATLSAAVVKITNGVPAAAAAGTDFVAPNAAITPATNTKITYDAKGLVTAGAALVEADIPTLSQSKITNLVSDLAAKASTTYVDTAITAATVGLLDDRGNYNASGNTFPTTTGSGAAGAVLKGDLWTISVAGTLGGVAVTAGDVIRALVDTPGQTAANWAIAENNFGYVAENSANKVTAFSSPTNTQYPSALLVSDQLALKANLASPTFTGTPASTTPATSDSSTRIATTAYVQAQGYGKKVTSTIGNGSATSFAITHNLNTLDVVVAVRKVSTGEQWYVDVTCTSTTVVTVSFGTAPTTNEYTVTVIG
jgi:hypothetical protein